MLPDDHYDEQRAEELTELERAAVEQVDGVPGDYIIPIHGGHWAATFVDTAADWQWPPATPGMTRRSLGWARTDGVPPRHTGTTRWEGLADRIMFGVLMLGIIIIAVEFVVMIFLLPALL